MSIHAPIKPFPVCLRREYLYDMQIGLKEIVVEAHVICVSSYRGNAITFDLKIDSNGAIFSYLPPNSFFDLNFEEASLSIPSFSSSGCINCPDENLHVSYWNLGEVTGYWPDKNVTVTGRYILTMDWPDANELIHMFAAKDGNFYFRPNHKLLISGAPSELPDYRKLHREWIVE